MPLRSGPLVCLMLCIVAGAAACGRETPPPRRTDPTRARAPTAPRVAAELAADVTAPAPVVDPEPTRSDFETRVLSMLGDPAREIELNDLLYQHRGAFAALLLGLRSPDDRVAFDAAERIDRQQLSVRDSARAAALLISALLDPDRDLDPDWAHDLDYIASTEDVTRLLTAIAAGEADEVAQLKVATTLANVVTTEHAPLVAAMLGRPETNALAAELANAIRRHSDAARSALPAVPDQRPAVAATPEAFIEHGGLDRFTALRRQDPRLASATLILFLTTADDRVVGPFLRALRASRADVRMRLPGPSPDPAFDGVATALLASSVSGARLAEVAISVPGCRTPELAAAIVERLPRNASPFPAFDPSPQSGVIDFNRRHGRVNDRVPEIHVLLDGAVPDAYLELLRSWLDGATPECAVPLLARIGDARSADAIARWMRSVRASDIHPLALQDLGAMRHPAIRDALSTLIDDGSEAYSRFLAVEALAIAHGVPRNAWRWSGSGPDNGRESTWVRMIQEGRPVEAILEFERHAYSFSWHPMPPDADPRLRALRSKQLEPRARRVEDAVFGDPVSFGEVQSAIRAGLLPWIEEMRPDTSPLGRDPRDICPFWLDRLESNDTVVDRISANFFIPWFGWSPAEDADDGLTTATRARTWWAANRDRLVWSRLGRAWAPRIE